MSTICIRLCLAVVCLLPSFSARAAAAYEVTIERGVAIPMRDGVVLRGDIYRPKAEGKFPILLSRTPYDKNQLAEFGVRAASAGYIVVAQDVRGRYTSKGDWYPFIHEAADGYDTVEWAAALTYSDHRVGMFGGSYVGATQMLAAVAHPPHLAGICPVVTPSNYHEGWVYQGGAFEEWFNQSWTSILAQDTLRRLAQQGSSSLLQREALPLRAYRLFSLPNLTEPSASLAALAPYYSDWLAHPTYDSYWKNISIEEHYPDIRVPALTTAAWYDVFQGGSLRNYHGLAAQAGTAAARAGQRLLIVIGGHAGSGRKIGDIDFGPDAVLYPEDDVTLAWYGFLFKNARNQLTSGPPVKYFLMGVNAWREAATWPPPAARPTQLFLHSEGKANSSSGNGTLSAQSPVFEPSDQYRYDPAHPVPTKGSSLCCDAEVPNGPRDQRPIEARADVLVYSTPPLTHDLSLVGPVSVQLYAASSAVDTDFTARLVDVAPDGYARNLTEGIIRARYRDSSEHPSLLTPAKVYKFAIDLWSTAYVCQAGHRLRLEISSSNFPRFDTNLNTGEPSAPATKLISADNRVLHDSSHPSSLTISVLAP